jgi:hypothetical protein
MQHKRNAGCRGVYDRDEISGCQRSNEQTVLHLEHDQPGEVDRYPGGNLNI